MQLLQALHEAVVQAGDMLLVSPSAAVEVASFVAVHLCGNDGQRYIYGKRLLLPFPHFKRDGTGPLIAVEMFRPAQRLCLFMRQVEAVHAIVGVSTGGREPMRELRPC